MTTATTTAMPSTVNHYPVIAGVLHDQDTNLGVIDGYVMVRQVGTHDRGDYATWHIWWYSEDYTSDDATGDWIAENGRYDMTYDEALADFAERAKLGVPA